MPTKTDTTMERIYKLERKNFATDDIYQKVRSLLREEEMSDYQKAKIATMLLLDCVNGGSRSKVQSGVICGILDTHRYLQSEGLNALLTALGNYGRLAGHSDARNEYVKATCEMLPDVLSDRIYWRD
jgi:hypothetical protein